MSEQKSLYNNAGCSSNTIAKDIYRGRMEDIAKMSSVELLTLLNTTTVPVNFNGTVVHKAVAPYTVVNC